VEGAEAPSATATFPLLLVRMLRLLLSLPSSPARAPRQVRSAGRGKGEEKWTRKDNWTRAAAIIATAAAVVTRRVGPWKSDRQGG